jgi:hypothetical protein
MNTFITTKDTSVDIPQELHRQIKEIVDLFNISKQNNSVDISVIKQIIESCNEYDPSLDYVNNLKTMISNIADLKSTNILQNDTIHQLRSDIATLKDKQLINEHMTNSYMEKYDNKLIDVANLQRKLTKYESIKTTDEITIKELNIKITKLTKDLESEKEKNIKCNNCIDTNSMKSLLLERQMIIESKSRDIEEKNERINHMNTHLDDLNKQLNRERASILTYQDKAIKYDELTKDYNRLKIVSDNMIVLQDKLQIETDLVVKTLNDELSTYKSSKKGKLMEKDAFNALCKINEEHKNHFNIENVSNKNNNGDIEIISNYTKYKIIIDIKNYKNVVDSGEIKKLKNDVLTTNSEMGFLVSTSTISTKSNYSYDLIINDKTDKLTMIVYITNFDLDYNTLYCLLKQYEAFYSDLLETKNDEILKSITNLIKNTEPAFNTFSGLYTKLINNASSNNNGNIACETAIADFSKKSSIYEKINEIDLYEYIGGRTCVKSSASPKYLLLFTIDNIDKYLTCAQSDFPKQKKTYSQYKCTIYEIIKN